MKHKREIPLQQTAQQYVLLLEDEGINGNPLLRRRVLPIASRESPHLACGVAFRVGWTRHSDQQPIYRLKVRVQSAHSQKVTLPHFFVLEHGVFVAYLPTGEASHAMASASTATMDELVL